MGFVAKLQEFYPFNVWNQNLKLLSKFNNISFGLNQIFHAIKKIDAEQKKHMDNHKSSLLMGTTMNFFFDNDSKTSISNTHPRI